MWLGRGEGGLDLYWEWGGGGGMFCGFSSTLFFVFDGEDDGGISKSSVLPRVFGWWNTRIFGMVLMREGEGVDEVVQLYKHVYSIKLPMLS